VALARRINHWFINLISSNIHTKTIFTTLSFQHCAYQPTIFSELELKKKMATNAPDAPDQAPNAQNAQPEAISGFVPIPEPKLLSRKDTSLREFLTKMDDYAPIVCHSEYYVLIKLTNCLLFL
jgi:hypothetical protein